MNYGGDIGASQFAGFTKSPANVGEHAFGSQQKGSRPSAQTLRDVTVRQLIRENMSSDNDQVTVDGIELTTFSIVGRIVSRTDSSTTLHLKVDDGTGAMEVVHYLEDSNELMNAASQEWVVNQYVRVCGSMRAHNNKRSMMALRVKTVKDFNEVTCHSVQAIFQHLHLTKGGAPPAAGPQAFSTMPATQAGSTQQQAAPAAVHSTMGGSGNKLHDDVLTVYNEATGEHGASFEDVLAVLQQRGLGYTMPQVMQAVEYLTNEGQLYSTIDEQHHRSTSV